MFAPGIIEASNRDGKMADIWPKMQNSDGSYKKVANWGPHMNGDVFLFISDKDAIQQILSSKDEKEFPNLPFTTIFVIY